MNVNTIDLTPEQAKTILADGRLIVASREELEVGQAAIAERDQLSAEVERLRAREAKAWDEFRALSVRGGANLSAATARAEAAEEQRVREWNARRDAEAQRDVAKAVADAEGARAESADAHVADLRGALEGISRASEYLGDCASPELIELGLRLKTCCTNALMRTPAQSLARVKAEAAAEKLNEMADGGLTWDAVTLRREAEAVLKEAENGR